MQIGIRPVDAYRLLQQVTQVQRPQVHSHLAGTDLLDIQHIIDQGGETLAVQHSHIDKTRDLGIQVLRSLPDQAE